MHTLTSRGSSPMRHPRRRRRAKGKNARPSISELVNDLGFSDTNSKKWYELKKGPKKYGKNMLPWTAEVNPHL